MARHSCRYPEGIGDDAALFENEYLIAKDIMIENIHFLKSTPIDLVIRKLFTSNVSDIAAMGGSPVSVLLGIGADKSTDMAAIAEAAAVAADFYGVKIIGGDTSSSKGELFLSMTIIGKRGKNLLLRNGAKPGNVLYLSRPVGLAKAALEKELGIKEHPVKAFSHYDKTAEKEAGILLGTLSGVTAAADISDGLGSDAGHIADMSGVQITIDADRLNFPCIAFLKDEAISYAVSSGEEFALIFTAEKEAACNVERNFEKQFGRKPIKIGYVSAGEGCFLKTGDKLIDISSTGYEHFL